MLRSEFVPPDELIARYPRVNGAAAAGCLHLTVNAGTIVGSQLRRICPRCCSSGDLLRLQRHPRAARRGCVGVRDERRAHRAAARARCRYAPRPRAASAPAKPPRPGSRGSRVVNIAPLVAGRRDEILGGPLSRTRRWRSSNGTARCRCRPIFDRAAEAIDRERYRDGHARVPWRRWRPTAGLHFDAALLERCAPLGSSAAASDAARGCGHVSAGARRTMLDAHHMHSEVMTRFGGRCGAGRTRGTRDLPSRSARPVVRALERAAAGGTLAPHEGETRLFIAPGHRFRGGRCAARRTSTCRSRRC